MRKERLCLRRVVVSSFPFGRSLCNNHLQPASNQHLKCNYLVKYPAMSESRKRRTTISRLLNLSPRRSVPIVPSSVSTSLRLLPPATPPSCLESRTIAIPPSRYHKGATGQAPTTGHQAWARLHVFLGRRGLCFHFLTEAISGVIKVNCSTESLTDACSGVHPPPRTG